MAKRIEAKGLLGNAQLYRVDPMEIIVDDGWNPRIDFVGEKIDGKTEQQILVDFIEKNGCPGVLTVQVHDDNTLHLIDGERRLRAIHLLAEKGIRIKSVQANIKPVSASKLDMMLQAIVANEGKRLAPIELADAYQRMINWGWTQGEIAARVGKTQGHVSQTLKLIVAGNELKAEVAKGNITATKASQIVTQADKNAKQAKATQVMPQVAIPPQGDATGAKPANNGKQAVKVEVTQEERAQAQAQAVQAHKASKQTQKQASTAAKKHGYDAKIAKLLLEDFTLTFETLTKYQAFSESVKNKVYTDKEMAIFNQGRLSVWCELIDKESSLDDLMTILQTLYQAQNNQATAA